MKKKLAVLLAAALTLGMTACGASKGAGDTGKSEKSMVYAVEAGSAGEAVAKEEGYNANSVASKKLQKKRDFSTIPFRLRQMP